MGYVYVVKAENMNMYKIGIASASDARLKTLQAGSPIRLLLLKSVYFDNSKEVESRLHDIFARSRVHNEWFDLRKDELDLLLLYLDEPEVAEDRILLHKIMQMEAQEAGTNEIIRRVFGVTTKGRQWQAANRKLRQLTGGS